MRTRTYARSIAVTSAALVALTPCRGGGDEAGGGGAGGDAAGSGEKQVNIYGTDGNMGNALGEDFSEQGALAGMKGTTPLTELGPEFTDRLLEVDPNLQDYNYAGETYDAVIVTALAAQAAGTNDANTFKAYVNGITTGGDKCSDYAACLQIINSGSNVD